MAFEIIRPEDQLPSGVRRQPEEPGSTPVCSCAAVKVLPEASHFLCVFCPLLSNNREEIRPLQKEQYSV